MNRLQLVGLIKKILERRCLIENETKVKSTFYHCDRSTGQSKQERKSSGKQKRHTFEIKRRKQEERKKEEMRDQTARYHEPLYKYL